jgi:hypothetical protein
VDHLAQLIEFRVYFSRGPLDTLLGQIDRVGKQAEASLNLLCIAALFHFDAPGFEELIRMLVKFVLGDWFHSFKSCLP